MEVILEFLGRGGIFALGEIVNIQEIFASEEVGNDLVVLGPVDLGVKASGEGEVPVCAPLCPGVAINAALSLWASLNFFSADA